MVPADDERPCLKTGSRHLTKLTKGVKLFQLAKLLYDSTIPHDLHRFGDIAFLGL